MATPQKPTKLYFTSPVYARGEHVIGQNAVKDDGKVNMVVIPIGSTAIFKPEIARDLIISKQAINLGTASREQIDEAEAIVAERQEYAKKSATLKKAA